MARSIRIVGHVFAMAAVICSSAAPIPLQCDSTSDDTEEFCTEMMQKQRSFQPSAEVDVLPDTITWLHVPRTGESFLYTLLSSTSICPDFDGDNSFELRAVTTDRVAKGCPRIYKDKRCVSLSDSAYGMCAEMPIGSSERWADAEGNIIGMFRQPEIRLLSDFHYSGDRYTDFESFANGHLGCFTKKLTYKGNEEGVDGHCGGLPPTWEDVDLAKQRVRTGFAFIGMTDEWNLSMCLFNAMFGEQCRAIQFQSYGYHTSDSNSSDVDEINGFVDVYDLGVWKIAQSIFTENLRRFDVSEETCLPCSD